MPDLPLFIHQRIAEAGSVHALQVIREEVAAGFRTASPPVDPGGYSRSVNELHDSIIRRAVQLAEREMENRGMGLPPVSYAFIQFGSGGRSEQTLWSDQDNGIVYADTNRVQCNQSVKYFAKFSEVLTAFLESIGYPPCDGEVICRNPMWRKPVSSYLDMLNEWLAQPVWENIRYALIVADLRCLYGNARLANLIKERLYKTIADTPGLLRLLLKNTLHRKIALGVFGQLITERYGEAAGGVDIKYGVYIPFVNAIRLLTIQAGIMESSTLARLNRLAEIGAVTEELANDWREAFLTSLKMRAYAAANGKLPSDRLTPAVKNELKLSLHTGEWLQKYVRHHIEKEMRQ